ncbi:MAG: hypothetical protein PF636_00020 [Actinomycetota bacterium]|jgi:predicted choloylglycine hydrolase|nr:hypothetical protein [Actinomycetota bacterium]
MSELAAPTPERAEHILREVDYEKRLVGIKMAAMGAGNHSSLYTLAGVASFIHIDDYETAMRDTKSTVGYIDPSALARWVSEVLEDEELATAVLEREAAGENYGSVAMPIKELLLERIEQCREVLAPAG